MGTIRRIYQNTLVLSIAEVISRALQFIIMLYAARMLSQGDFGVFNVALSISLIAVILADLGINTYIIREIARDKTKASRFFGMALQTKLVLSVVTFALLLLVMAILNFDPLLQKITLIIWLFTILSSFTELCYSIFRSFEQMHYDALLKITRMVLLTAATLYILLSRKDVALFSVMFVIVEFVIVAIAFYLVGKKFIALRLESDLKKNMLLIKKAFPFGLAFVFGTIYFYIGTVMLGYLKGNEEAALLSAAYNIALALLFIPTVYTNAIYPVLSRFFEQSKDKLKLLYEKSFKYLYIIGLPISLGIFLLSEEIIEFLYGSLYSPSSAALQIISLYLFIKFLNFLLGMVLSSINQQRKRMYGQAATALFNVIVCIVMIPWLGFIGAALATLITEVVLFLLYFVFVSRSWYWFNFLPIIPKPLFAVLVMSLFIYFAPLPLFATIPLAAGIYGILIVILKTFDKKDMEIVRQVMQYENQKLPAN